MQIKHYKESIKRLLSKKQYKLLLVSLFVLAFSATFTILLLDKTNPIKLKDFEVKSRDGKIIPSKIQINKFEDNTYSYRITNKQAQVQINKANINPEETENYIFVDKPTDAEGDKDIKTDILFVDDTDFKFESANVTLPKKKDQPINAILKCETWDFDKEKGTCNKWNISDIVPTITDNEISFNVSHFSAYAGAYLEILNVQSDLTVNDTWEVRFRTYGTSNLDIQAIDSTIWGTDISYINFYCGDSEISNVYQDNKVFIENYNCDGQISKIQNTAVTPGVHTLNFKFGETDTIAHNFACDSGTLADTCNVTTVQSNTNGSTISGTGNLVIKSGGNLTTNAAESFTINMDGNVTIESGGAITGNLANLTAANFDLQNGGSINANTKGSASSSGSGQGNDGTTSSGAGGASYGGAGGNGNEGVLGGTSFYGSVSAPTDYGSGGGLAGASPGGVGGGAVRITVTGTATIAGTLSANGGNGTTSGGTNLAGGGGSGGSIYITAATLAGAGTMTANGGTGPNQNDPDGGGGGGGRIALYYTSKTFNGTMQAAGGSGPNNAKDGGAGTIYEKPSGQTDANLTLNNTDRNAESVTQLPSGTWTFNTVNVTGNAYFDIPNGVTITATSSFAPTSNFFLQNISSTGTFTYPTLDLTTTGSTSVIYGNGTKWPLRDVTVSSGSLSMNGAYSLRNVTVSTGATLTHQSNTSAQTYDMQLTISGNLDVNGTGTISTTGKGYASTTGTGQGTDGGTSAGAGGGSYGAAGGAGSGGTALGGSIYGSITAPTDLGSGGGAASSSPGGAGGGYIRLIVTGTTTVSGSIVSNGGSGGTGAGSNLSGAGGSGGSIYITTGALAGSGSITADGGTGANQSQDGAGGGGGRIALYYTTKTFNGTLQAAGGSGPDTAADGAAGTVYEKPTSLTNGNLTWDNGSRNAETSSQLAAGTYTFDTITAIRNVKLDITNGVTLTAVTAFNPTLGVYLTNTSTTGTFTYPTLDITTTGTSTIVGGTAKWPLQDITISSGTLSLNGSYSIRNLNVTGGTLTHEANTTAQTYSALITASGDVTVGASGTISVASKGYASTSGTGQGTDGTTGGGAGGGGYGGTGGTGSGGPFAGGSTYGSSTNPTDIGSGGGQTGSSAGGAGGGYLSLNVTGTTTVSGAISANGATGATNAGNLSGGGGSGGTISIITGTLAGSANISANGGTGGNGSQDGGGGGGGRISIFSGTSTYSGTISVTGGTGPDTAADGNTGTTYNDLSSPSTSITAICSTSGNTCTPSGTAASPQQAYSVTSIAGSTAESDTSLDSLQISIKDTNTNQWLNSGGTAFNQGTEQRFSLSSVSQTLPYTGSVNWSYNSNGVPWVIDHTYLITIAATNPRYTGTQTLSFTFSNSPPTVSSVSASQQSSGTVNVSYNVTDNESSSTTIYLGYDTGITLASDLNTGTTGVVVSDASLLPTSGRIMIDDEFITYTGKTGNTLNGTITRGANNTLNTTHTTGAVIWAITTNITGDTGTVTNGNSKSIVWTAKSDLNGLVDSSVKTQVISNDGASSSMIGKSESSTFAIDVKDPTLTAVFRIDASLATPLIYIPCTDDHTLQMNLGTASDLSTTSYIAHSSTSTFSAASLTYSAGMTLYGRCKDSFSNTTTIQTAVIPGIPSNLFYQDVSNPDLSDWREFLAWGIVDATSISFDSYEIYRKENSGAYSLLTTITDRQLNYYVDTDLDNSIEYSYKIRSVDDNGNISAYSSVITDTPDASGGTDLSSPTISSVAISNVSTTTATITWTTNKFSNSDVYLEATSTYPGSNRSDYDSSQGNPSMVTSHSVILSGLSPSTTYSFLVESTDASDNIASSSNNSYQFTTEDGPQITNVSVTEIFDTQATITWKTNINATSYVIYSENADLSSPSTTVGSDDLDLNHSVTITGLEVGTNYYFYVRSKDGSDNTTENKNIVNGSVQYYFLSTTIDNEDPVISSVQVALTGEEGATITWSTDEDANSIVEWGTSSSLGQTTQIADIYTTYHSISLTGLTANTRYYYKVKSKDRSNNESENSVSNFTTNDVTVVDNEQTLEEQIEDGISSIVEDADQSLIEAILEALAKNPNLEDISDDTLTDYLLEITSSTFSGPTIGGSNLTIEPGATSATVSWVTNRPSNSMVAYVKDSEYNSESANPYVIEVGDSGASVTEHTVVVEGLQPETTYHIQSRSKGSFGPMSASADNIFTTTSQTADIDSIEIRNVNENGVTLGWNTTIPTRSRIIITDTTTGEAQTDANDSFITGHSYTTDELTPSTNYSAQVVSIDENGNETESSTITFATVLNSSPPTISDVRVTTSLVPGKVEQVQTIISWRTNKPATSKIIYDEGVRSNGELRLSIPEDTSLRREHIIISSVFSSGKVYSYKIQSTDTGGNTGESQNYTLLTPQPRESVVDLIVKNLEEMFGFLK